jgi:hypothetical protein
LQQGGAQKELADSLRITHQPDEPDVRSVFPGEKAQRVWCRRYCD